MLDPVQNSLLTSLMPKLIPYRELEKTTTCNWGCPY